MPRTIRFTDCMSCQNPQWIRTEAVWVSTMQGQPGARRVFSKALRYLDTSIHNPEGLESVWHGSNKAKYVKFQPKPQEWKWLVMSIIAEPFFSTAIP